MATGRLAFPGNTAALTHDAILHRAPVSVSVLNAEVPPKLAEIVSKALEKDRNLRYQNASEMRTDLQRLNRDMELTELRLADTTAVSQLILPKRQIKLTGLMIAIVLLAIAGAIVFWRLSLPSHREARILMQRRITTNPPENPVYAAAVSPDGRYLAYADFTGVFVRLFETGETHSLPLPQSFCFR